MAPAETINFSVEYDAPSQVPDSAAFQQTVNEFLKDDKLAFQEPEIDGNKISVMIIYAVDTRTEDTKAAMIAHAKRLSDIADHYPDVFKGRSGMTIMQSNEI